MEQGTLEPPLSLKLVTALADDMEETTLNVIENSSDEAKSLMDNLNSNKDLFLADVKFTIRMETRKLIAAIDELKIRMLLYLIDPRKCGLDAVNEELTNVLHNVSPRISNCIGNILNPAEGLLFDEEEEILTGKSKAERLRLEAKSCVRNSDGPSKSISNDSDASSLSVSHEMEQKCLANVVKETIALKTLIKVLNEARLINIEMGMTTAQYALYKNCYPVITEELELVIRSVKDAHDCAINLFME